LLIPGGTFGHRLLTSATQDPIAHLCCAIADDDHNIKMAPIIRMIFATEGPPTGVLKRLAAQKLIDVMRFDIELNQTADCNNVN
jgi:hypothetical protein